MTKKQATTITLDRLPLFAQLKGAAILLLSVLLLLHPKLSTADAETESHENIRAAVEAFTGGRHGVDFEIQNIDPRLRLKACESTLHVSQPFASTSTLQVECLGEGGWKIFLSLSEVTAARTTSVETSPESSASTEPVFAVVAARQLERGIHIRPGDLELGSFSSSRIRRSYFSEPIDLIGMQTTQTIPKGTLLSNNMVRPAFMVIKGKPVTVIYESGGLLVSNEGISLDSAGLGEKVSVQLSDSEKVISGIVESTGMVRMR